MSDAETSKELSYLAALYEEPFFQDHSGNESATGFLTKWKDSPAEKHPWIVVVGEYGTGKTALTKVLLYRWMQDYLKNPLSPIPFRIELSSFTRQFDSRTLLHQFLDTHKLGHLPIEFVEHLIRTGRIVLLLDGYDEMAQHLHARERRACLETLAHFSAAGGNGMLTSRPNYFTEAEELNILELVYRSLSAKYKLQPLDTAVLEKERETDALFQKHFLERCERILRDLDRNQTECLIKRALKLDAEGQTVVLRVLDRIFRSTQEGNTLSLSGKPIIISYLLEIVEELKSEDKKQALLAPGTKLGEWQIYDLIVNQLMVRDFKQRSSDMLPGRRKEFLKRLAVKLSQKETLIIDEAGFTSFVQDDFLEELKKLPKEIQKEELDRLFADLRGSGTLTRISDSGTGRMVWRFSHNSLREFLVASRLCDLLNETNVEPPVLPTTEPMRSFVASLPPLELRRLMTNMQNVLKVASTPTIGTYLELIWSAGLELFKAEPDPRKAFLAHVCGDPVSLRGLTLSRLSLSRADKPLNLQGCNLSGSTLCDLLMDACDLTKADLSDVTLDGVSLKEANLREAQFARALLVDTNMTDAVLEGANFCGIDPVCRIIVGDRVLENRDAVGWLAASGAKTDDVPKIFIAKHRASYEIALKISRKLLEQPKRQLLGLVQRGAAKQDTSAARKFIEVLFSSGFAHKTTAHEELVELTTLGRTRLQEFASGTVLPNELADFFECP
jgi:uncharacterized protein YjbI with pentapeptide repeats